MNSVGCEEKDPKHWDRGREKDFGWRNDSLTVMENRERRGVGSLFGYSTSLPTLLPLFPIETPEPED